jgi:hypothetical protein
MVAPFVGPIYTGSTSNPYNVWSKMSFTQRQPISRPLPHYSHRAIGYATNENTGEISPLSIPFAPFWSYDKGGAQYANIVSFLEAQAYDKLWAKVHGKHTASLGTSLAEVSESAAMVANRVGSISKAYTALKRGRIGDLWDALALKDPVSRARAKRVNSRVQKKRVDLANGFLELEFGWRPMIQDIYDAINVIQKASLRTGFTSGKAMHRVHEEYSRMEDGGFRHTRRETGLIAVSMGCKITTINPNVALANLLGLVNPATVAWNVTPFSYLVNWFIPVDRFLNSFSNDWGYTVALVWVTHFRRVDMFDNAVIVANPEAFNSSQDVYSYTHWRDYAPSLPIPSLFSRVKLPGGDLFGKASTSVAVLVQQLSQRK